MSPEAQTARGTRPEATLFLHIGVGKTGTTSIQQYFAENRQHLREIGIDYPETGLHPTGGHHILSHKWGGWLDPKDFAQTPDAAWEDLGRHVAHGRHRYLVSSERFCGIAYSEDWRDRLEFIRQSLAGVRVKIVCYIRRTEDLIESAYRQKVKIEGFSDPIDEFVEFCTKEGNEFFDQYELCRRYAAVFGPENVIARVYDTALFENNSVVHDLLAQIGCASSDLPPQDSEFTNSSLGAASCALLTDPRLEHWRRDKAFRAAIRRALDDKSFSSPGQRRLLSKAQMDRIRERFEQNNRKLVDEFVVGDTGNFLAPPPDDADLGFQTSREQFSLDDIIRLLTEIQKIQTRIRNERDLARDERERALRKLDHAKRHPWKSFRNALRGLHQDG